MPDWTPEQRMAIETTGCDLLVSASAGTGKTAVLVERIARLALDGESSPGLDRFLIVTFTEAAAAEMRERIGAALRKAAADSPNSALARRQAMLLDKAQISTLHAFCSALIRQHFHRLALDPDFSILDPDEAKLLRNELAHTLFEEEFDRADPRFLTWLDSFSGANPEANARERLLELHDFLGSLDSAQEWSACVRKEYPLDAEGQGMLRPFEAHGWFSSWRESFCAALEELLESLTDARKTASCVLPKYADWMDVFLGAVENAVQASERDDWDAAISAIQTFQFARIPSPGSAKSPESEELKSRIQELKKAFIHDLQEDFAVLTPDQAARAHAACAPEARLLLDLVERFQKAYTDAKRLRAVVDFNDLEQLCLRLLRSETAPDEPSEVARQCQERFEHVLVDEYQDINPVQDAILRFVSRQTDPDRVNNLFAVGDVKQSIYQFRLADPDIFLHKYDTFPKLGSAGPVGEQGRVDLSRNFRSRSGVLHAANFLFERIMQRSSAGLDYDEAAALVPGAVFPEGLDGSPAAEVHLIERRLSETEEEDPAEGPAEENDSNKTEESNELADWAYQEREALCVGRRILEMVDAKDGLFVSERGANETVRRATYRDIVVLLRSMTGAADAYLSVFTRLGIPAYCDFSKGFFRASEVRDVLNLLRLIDNPLQDIPLAAVLRSPLEGWNETELAQLRALAPERPFCDALEAARQIADDAGANATPPVVARAAQFAQRLEAWRTRARRGALADLLAAIYDATDYPAYVSGLNGAEVRRANLRRLYDLACGFDTFSRQGLARFLNYIEQLRREDRDLSAAAPLGESENVVRIMTIHKSKGLEFPVVILPDLAHRFNISDNARALLLCRKNGMALQVTDLEEGVYYASPALREVRRAKRREQLAEEMRILYVALTRARERLLLCASIQDIEKTFARWCEAVSQAENGKLAAKRALRALAPVDWIGPALAFHPEIGASMGASSDGAMRAEARFTLYTYPEEVVAAWESPAAEMEKAATQIRVESAEAARKGDAAVARIAWEYPHSALSAMPARISAGELKRRLEEPDETGERSRQAITFPADFDLESLVVPATPNGVRVLSPTERGSLTHLVLQHLNLLRPVDYAGLSAQIDGLIERNLLDEEERDAIDIGAIERFFASSLGRRVLAQPPDRVWREVPFLLGLSPSEAGASLPSAYDGVERIRVQGIIDCIVEEEDGLVLIDYKTDAVAPESASWRVKHYNSQMLFYARAIEAIFQKSLSEAYLYFLAIDEAVPVALERGMTMNGQD